MKPFSPLYFIRENKARCILLMAMLFLSFGVYLGGLYVTNPLDNWKSVIEYFNDFVNVNASSEDTDYKELNGFIDEMSQSGDVSVIRIGGNSGMLLWETIMGFDSGSYSLTFSSVDDFRLYCGHYDIDCDFSSLKPGSLILSERMANNHAISLGQTVDSDFSSNIYDTFTLDAVTKEKGYTAYFIDDSYKTFTAAILLGNGISGKELNERALSLADKYDVSVNFGLEESIDSQLGVFSSIYIFIVIFLAIILAVTINAAFAGMYQKRNFELAVYRAIGISKRKIFGKIIGELVIIDIIALAAGAVVTLVFLYLFNNLVLYPVGKYLCYFHPTALFALLLCNITSLLPLVILRLRQIKKADICEY